MKFGIRKKIILSFFLVILIMCSVTIVFLRFFAVGYVNSEASNVLKKEASEFAEILSETTNTDFSMGILKARFNTKIYYFNYSMYLLDANGHVVAGYNTDGINAENSELNKIFEKNVEQPGSKVITIADKEYSFYIKPIINFYSGNIVGYVAPFYSAKTLVNDDVLVTFCIFTVCIAAFFSIILGCLLSWPLTTNIYKLKKRTKLIAERKYDEYVPIKSNDELKELSNSIEDMVTSLKEYDLGQKTFLQNASHELRTPLMSIRGYMEGISDGVFDYDKISPEITAQVVRLEKIVEEILYLSKIETAHVMDFEKMKISDLYREVESRVRGLLRESGKELDIKSFEDGEISVDGDNFATAITNIISNCSRYAKEKIVLETESDGKTLTIRVYDDGPGILPEELPHIFERFYRGKAGKHGLGLSITKAIAQSHGGNVEARNRIDNGKITGAEFTIFLPLKK